MAAVNHHRGSDDEGSCIRTQPQDSCSDLLRLAGPADGLRHSRARELLLLPLRSASAKAIHHRCVNDPGAYGVDADVLRGVIESRRSGESDYAMFCRNISRLILEAFDPGTRGSVHDCAAPLLEHQWDLVLHAKEHAAEINTHYPVPLFLRDIDCHLWQLFNTGVVEGGVQPPEGFDGLIQSRLHVLSARHVAPDG